ncbi:MAG: hypothetical protein M0P27_00085 [Bacteroidales bacterium]|nr:hypothetical protein [Bacteroidales bacterium]
MNANITLMLRGFGSVPLSTAAVDTLLVDYNSPKDKVSYMVEQGELIRIKRGLYCVSPTITGQRLSTEIVANHLYGPSYISLETALSFYNLIPERITSTQSVVTKRTKTFQTPLGRFTYSSIPDNYYSIGIRQKSSESGSTFLIASPEKALCDLILLRPNLRIVSKKAMFVFLTKYMRIDLQELKSPDLAVIDECIATQHKSTQLRCLRKVIEHECF